MTQIHNKNNSLQMLESAWGKEYFYIDQCWLDTTGIPTDISALEALLHQLPLEHIIIREIKGATPYSQGEPKHLNLSDIGSLEDRLKQGSLHVFAKDLHLVNEAFRNLLEKFVQYTSPVWSNLGGSSQVEATITMFVSSANTFVPYHADPAHDFFFQIYGDKYFTLFPNNDLELFSSEAREQIACGGSHVGQIYREEMEEKSTTFYLKPNTSIYKPPYAPHWVQNKDEISMSIVIGLVTEDVKRLLNIHRFNGKLRSLGWKINPIGSNPVTDDLKNLIYKSLRMTKASLKGSSNTLLSSIFTANKN